MQLIDSPLGPCFAAKVWHRERGVGHHGLKLGSVLDGPTSSFLMPAVAGTPLPLRLRWWPPTPEQCACLADWRVCTPVAAGTGACRSQRA